MREIFDDLVAAGLLLAFAFFVGFVLYAVW